MLFWFRDDLNKDDLDVIQILQLFIIWEGIFREYR